MPCGSAIPIFNPPKVGARKLKRVATNADAKNVVKKVEIEKRIDIVHWISEKLKLNDPLEITCKFSSNMTSCAINGQARYPIADPKLERVANKSDT